MAYATQNQTGKELNRLYESDLPVHGWYRFVLSFPPHLVRTYIEKLSLSNDQRILDPFCGTGTTLVEAKKLGIVNIGVEANPVVHFAASVKTEWDIDPKGLIDFAESIANEAQDIVNERVMEYGPLFQTWNFEPVQLRTLNPEQSRLLIKDSISPLPLHKILTLLEYLENKNNERYERHAKLALAKQAVHKMSNLRFGPEIGVGKIKRNTQVLRPWMDTIKQMALDLKQVQDLPETSSTVYCGDSRELSSFIEPASIDVVITSPPYPNEKDYSRTTRLESVLLGFMSTRIDLRKSKQQFIRSNTRGVYKADTDDEWVANLSRIQELADRIEQRRIELGKTSGFEKLYAQVVRLYFGGMARHLDELKLLLRPGAKLAYVVGDQASYFRIMIRTGEILAEVAENLGYDVLGIDLFRTRFSTATKNYLREEVILLQWNG